MLLKHPIAFFPTAQNASLEIDSLK